MHKKNYAQESLFKGVCLRKIQYIFSGDIAAVTFVSLVFKGNFILYFWVLKKSGSYKKNNKQTKKAYKFCINIYFEQVFMLSFS